MPAEQVGEHCCKFSALRISVFHVRFLCTQDSREGEEEVGYDEGQEEQEEMEEYDQSQDESYTGGDQVNF